MTDEFKQCIGVLTYWGTNEKGTDATRMFCFVMYITLAIFLDGFTDTASEVIL